MWKYKLIRHAALVLYFLICRSSVAAQARIYTFSRTQLPQRSVSDKKCSKCTMSPYLLNTVRCSTSYACQEDPTDSPIFRVWINLYFAIKPRGKVENICSEPVKNAAYVVFPTNSHLFQAGFELIYSRKPRLKNRSNIFTDSPACSTLLAN